MTLPEIFKLLKAFVILVFPLLALYLILRAQNPKLPGDERIVCALSAILTYLMYLNAKADW